MPDEPAAPPDRLAAAEPTDPPIVRPPVTDLAEQPASSARWRVDGRLLGLKIGGTAVFALATLVLWPDRLGAGLSGVAALGLAVLAIRDLIAPVRLAADPSGVTVIVGFARRERLSWQEIDRVRVDRRRRLGTVAEFLEIDAGEGLHLFSSYDLGESPGEAATALRYIRSLDHGAPPVEDPPGDGSVAGTPPANGS